MMQTMQQFMQQIFAEFATNLTNKLDERFIVFERSNGHSIKLEMLGQKTDSFALPRIPVSTPPPTFVYAPALKQFPQYTVDNKWKPK